MTLTPIFLEKSSTTRTLGPRKQTFPRVKRFFLISAYPPYHRPDTVLHDFSQ